ncbi:MAG: hypothetical protein O2820_08245 [Planctomycetota bacterium]|nr:hypothetical protein [Planctomycetota bacterium]MDA1249200.1 hypothetical protein [Planctomycetota bacterium]
MKRWGGILLVILAVTVTADFAAAQRPEGDRPREGGEAGRPGGGRPAEGGRPGEGRPGEGGRGGRPGEGRPGEGRPGEGGPGRGSFGGFGLSPIQAALDTDNDGVISAKEIENAVVALRTLDKNKDGKLDRDELRPPRPEGGFGGGPGGGRPGEGGRPGAGAPGGQGGSFADRILAFDKDKDGKISKEEAPEFLQRGFERMDTDKDGFISKKEIDELSSRFGGGGGRPGAGGRPGGEGGRPARPEGGAGGRPARPEGGAGGRPARPEEKDGGADSPRRPAGDDA